MEDVGPIIGGIIAGLAGLIVSIFNQKHQEGMEERRRKWEKLQQKKQIRSRLLGAKFFMVNICYQRGYSLIQKSKYISIANKGYPYIENAPERSHSVSPVWNRPSKNNIKEFCLKHEKLSENEMDFAKKYSADFAIAARDLWEIIGLIQVSFNNTIDERDRLLKDLETAIYDYNGITFNPSEAESKDPNEWAKNKHIEIKKCLDDKIILAFDNQLNFLKDEIDADKEELEKTDESIKRRCYRICKFFCNP